MFRPANPPGSPLDLMTLWQGINSGVALCRMAEPAARAAEGAAGQFGELAVGDGDARRQAAASFQASTSKRCG